jgi:hypothetical protein
MVLVGAQRAEEAMAAEASNDSDTAPTGDAAGERRAAARARPSVTIDLTAEEIPAAREAAPDKAAADSPPGAGEAPQPSAASENARPKFSSAQFFGGAAKALPADEGWRRSLLAGAAGGVIALVVVLVLQSVGILPAPGRSAAERAAEQAKAAADAETALERRMTAAETMTDAISGMRQDLKSLSDKVAALDALKPTLASRSDLDALSANAAALTKRLDALPAAATRDDFNALAGRVGKLEAAVAAGGDGQAASSTALASLASQLNQAEADVRALSDKVTAAEARPAVTAGEDAVRAVAVASLRRASADGQPFAADVDMIANLGIGGGDIAIIRPLAAKGVATGAELAAAFPDVANAILAATAASDPNAGFFQRVWANVSGLVQVRPLGPMAGSDPPAIVSRMSDDARKGDLAAALAEREALPQAGKDASAEWAAKAADRVALDQAIGRIAEAAAGKAG